jgi:hypothetical protein
VGRVADESADKAGFGDVKEITRMSERQREQRRESVS